MKNIITAFSEFIGDNLLENSKNDYMSYSIDIFKSFEET